MWPRWKWQGYFLLLPAGNLGALRPQHPAILFSFDPASKARDKCHLSKNHRSLPFTVGSGAIWICAGWGWGSATQKFWILVDYLMTGCFLLPGEGRCVVMWSPSCPEVSLSCRLLSMGEEKLPLVTGSLMLIDVEECLTMDCASTTTGDMWAGSPMTLMQTWDYQQKQTYSCRLPLAHPQSRRRQELFEWAWETLKTCIHWKILRW